MNLSSLPFTVTQAVKLSRIITLLFSLLICYSVNGQSSWVDSLQDNYTQYQKKRITAEDYLKQVGQFIDEKFAQGILFERDDLVKILAPYKNTAWSTDSLSTYRINYFIMLSNNANYANREGESVYFLEKAEKEIFASHKQRSLMVAGRKCNTYLDKHNYKKVISTYEEVADYIEEFPQLIRDNAVNLNITTSYINIINPVVEAYSHLGDTIQVEATIKLAERIHDALTEQLILRGLKPQHQTVVTVNFYQNYLYFHKYFTLLDKQSESYDALKKMTDILYDPQLPSKIIVGNILPYLYIAKTDFFLRYKLNDSAAYYIDKLKNDAFNYANRHYTIHRFEATLLANKGLYYQAYKAAILAAQHTDSIQSVLVDDIDQMLYAHTASEENRTLLAEAEKKTNQRNVWIVAISAFSLLGIFSVNTHNKIKNKKAQKLITKLNQEANLRVAVLQEIKTSIRSEEQQKLAQDLHDSLAGTLATIKHSISYIDDGSLTPKQQENISHITSLLEKAYRQTRNKSHYLFNEDVPQHEKAYIEHLQKLIHTALPTNRYDSHIEIDTGSLAGAPIDLRIGILRIIQEILINIIKHASAKKIDITVYKENDLLFIHIENDGKIFDPNKISTSKTIGLRSIQERVKRLNGSIKFTPKGIGTETTICIPHFAT